LASSTPQHLCGFGVVLHQSICQRLSLAVQILEDRPRFLTPFVKHLTQQVKPRGGTRSGWDAERLDLAVKSRATVEQSKSHQDYGKAFNAPHKIIERLLGEGSQAAVNTN
jgi:hypothetical protein